MTFRSRRLLDLAHKMHTCTNCQAWSEDGLEPAHSPLGIHGKGKGLKGHDCFFAALCPRCHRWLDNQGGHGTDPSGIWESTREDKCEMFRRAMDITMLCLWGAGKLKVA